MQEPCRGGGGGGGGGVFSRLTIRSFCEPDWMVLLSQVSQVLVKPQLLNFWLIAPLEGRSY